MAKVGGRAVLLAAGRRRIARERLVRDGARPIRAPIFGGGEMLIHKSTRKPGWWQATLFDKDGEPYADSESEGFERLVEHMATAGIDWKSARDAR